MKDTHSQEFEVSQHQGFRVEEFLATLVKGQPLQVWDHAAPQFIQHVLTQNSSGPLVILPLTQEKLPVMF